MKKVDTLSIEIETESAAFEANTEAEVARMLRELADRIEARGLSVCGNMSIEDANGEDVGEWSFGWK